MTANFTDGLFFGFLIGIGAMGFVWTLINGPKIPPDIDKKRDDYQ